MQHSLYLHHKPSSLNTMPTLSTIGAACARAWGFTSGLVKDQYFNLVSLLLPGNGTDGKQNRTFKDSSVNDFLITPNGNATQGTFSPFSQTGWGNYFNGSSYLQVASNAAFAFGTGDFSIEFWFYPTVAATQRNISFPTANAPILNMTSSRTLEFGNYGISTIATTSNTLTLNAWNFCAASRVSGTLRLFINGDQGASVPDSTNFVQSLVNIGTDTGGIFATGYMADVRIVKGSGFTTSTVPIAPLTAISGTSLLTCQSNRFRDASGNGFTITTSGSPTVVAFSPFAPTQSYSASAVGGSGYFDGNADYLTVDASSQIFPTGTQAYSVEFWAYPTSLTTSSYPTFCQNSATGGWQIFYFNDGSANQNKIAIGIAGTGAIGTATFNTNVNQWVHVVATRTGNDHRLFINGILQIYASNSVSFASPSGASQQIVTSGGPQTYMAGLRTILGSIPTNYQTSSTTTGTSIFTPPTSPTTTTSQGASSPAFLLNFTNAGVVDATAKNVLETVGNAQISTGAAKFGTTSIYFDGDGDQLVFPASSLYALGTSNFTIELWAYSLDTGSSLRGIVDFRSTPTGTNGLLLRENSGGFLVWTNSGPVLTTTTGRTANQWQHVALVRASGTLSLYVNGLFQTSTPSYTTNLTDTQLRISGFVDTAASPYAYYGYLSNVRITKFARYSGTSTSTPNFTLPTAPFPVQ